MKLPAPSPNLAKLPPYIFVRLKQLGQKAKDAGKDVIDLSMGSPDLPTPPHIVDALVKAVREDKSTHRYPPANGLPVLRKAIATYYDRRFGVKLDPETEVLPLIGSKEGLAHLCGAYLNPGDAALLTNPCYPVHYVGPQLFGGRPVLMAMEEKNEFLPDFGAVAKKDLEKARFMFLNYPNNPTAATVDGLGFFKDAAAFAKKQGMFVVHDNAYSDLCFDGYRAPSFLQLEGGKELGVEFHSCSKTYNMAGWRVGFAVGSAEIIGALAKFKSNLDYGVAGFVQHAAAAALEGPQDCVVELAKTYQSRRDALCAALDGIGWKAKRPKASMYVWAKLPGTMPSMEFVEGLIQQEGVVISPGTGFGPFGEGYVRFSLIAEPPRLQEAAKRIGRYLSKLKVAR
jgi:LL-diaminopimelate aminotransferase